MSGRMEFRGTLFAQVPMWAVERLEAGPIALLVHIAAATYSGEKLSQAQFARKLGVAERTVGRWARELVDVGVVVPHRSGEFGTVAEWAVLYDDPGVTREFHRDPDARPEPKPEPMVQPAQVDSPDRFQDFWDLYPRREKKRRAEQAWGRLDAGERDRCLRFLTSARRVWDGAAATERTRRERFIPHPTTFLNDRRFDDERWAGDGGAWIRRAVLDDERSQGTTSPTESWMTQTAPTAARGPVEGDW
ncbi:MAG: hypothetical protein AAFZ07_28425 [Actinomycetota bacterium]